MKRALLFLSLLLAFSAPAYATFAYKIAMVVDPMQVVSNASNFAVEFKGTDNSLKQAGSGGQMQNALAYDARAFSDSTCTTALDFELDSYDASAPQLIMWIRIPTLSGSVATNYWICFGDASLNSNASSTGTWDSNYKTIWHLSEATNGQALDSTSNGNNSTTNVSTQATGQIGYGQSFNGSTESLVFPSVFANQSVFTISGWFKDTTSNYGVIVDARNSFGAGALVYTIITTGVSSLLFNSATATSTAVAADSSWHYVMATSNGTSGGALVSIYVDNNAVVTGAPTTITTWGVPRIARAFNDALYAGNSDEARISNISRSSDWRLAEYNNQSNPTAGGFYTSITYSANSSGGHASTVPLTGAGH